MSKNGIFDSSSRKGRSEAQDFRKKRKGCTKEGREVTESQVKDPKCNTNPVRFFPKKKLRKKAVSKVVCDLSFVRLLPTFTLTFMPILYQLSGSKKKDT